MGGRGREEVLCEGTGHLCTDGMQLVYLEQWAFGFDDVLWDVVPKVADDPENEIIL